MTLDKRRVLIDMLETAPHPLSGEELARRLGVSARSIRNYVATINRKGPIVATSHRGYALDPRGRNQLATLTSRPSQVDTPEHRLQYLCRRLAQASDPISVHDLADRLFVSESTLESDLTRAREVFRQHDLTLRRDHHLIWLEGAERSRRRIVRQTLQESGQGLVPTWHAFTEEYAHLDLPQLRKSVGAVIADSELEFNEYALADLLLHIAVTVDRMREEHMLPESERKLPPRDPVIEEARRRLTAVVEELFDLTLPDAEVEALYGVLAVRVIRASASVAGEAVIDPQFRVLVDDLLNFVSSKYLLGPADPAMQLKLALHVQNLVARARSGHALTHPMGKAFQQSHPLLHDLALDFAQRIEERVGIQVPLAEVDYLALHMGMQYVAQVEQRDQLTITLVVPEYHGLGTSVAATLKSSLRGRGVIEKVVPSLDFDPAEVTSDLVVSCVEVVGRTDAPIVTVSPFLDHADLDRVSVAVATELDRNLRRRIRTSLFTLIDPSVFLRVDAVSTREDALGLMCARLEEAGYVGPGFLTGVLDRERRSATSFGGDFAIPHSMRMDAEATVISVLVSEKPIPWGTSSVRLVLLFALSPDGRQVFRDGLGQIIRLLGDPANTAALIGAATDARSFLAALGELLDR